METDRKYTVNQLLRQTEQYNKNLIIQTEATRNLISRLIARADEQRRFPSENFVYDSTMGSRHANINPEKALVLGEYMSGRRAGRKSIVILKGDSSIVYVYHFQRLYAAEPAKPYSRQKTRSREIEIQYGGTTQVQAEGVNYIQWGSRAIRMLSEIIQQPDPNIKRLRLSQPPLPA